MDEDIRYMRFPKGPNSTARSRSKENKRHVCCFGCTDPIRLGEGCFDRMLRIKCFRF
ncbi:hypothetical protein T4C_12609 [Trichinella pseudospiralis]|uniref:Uncharacterized protein n=1 Tax=Trichinella pseudospiralis TaxID=6337 RepID=A0A0V1K6N7_TRIPS|nr:hypothetical protein T4C_12609 [Trichinella pseudospiralis]